MIDVEDYFDKYILKQQTFTIDTHNYSHINICIYNLQFCYETSRQNKKKESLVIIKVLILLRLLLRFIECKLLMC